MTCPDCAARAVPAETLADRVRALADNPALMCDHHPGDDDGGHCVPASVVRALRALLDPAEQPATREDDA